MLFFGLISILLFDVFSAKSNQISNKKSQVFGGAKRSKSGVKLTSSASATFIKYCWGCIESAHGARAVPSSRIALRNSRFLGWVMGEAISNETSEAPDPHPMRVTEVGSPPNEGKIFDNILSAATISDNPELPLHEFCSHRAMNPYTPRR